MSHITTIKTNVKLKDQKTLATALDELQMQFPTLTYSYDQSSDSFRVRYPPIEGYQKNGNLAFIRSGNAYQMQGDRWMCSNEFDRVTGQILVNYQKSGVQNYLSRRRFSTTTQASKDGIVVVARRY
jgi:hypothetical protein